MEIISYVIDGEITHKDSMGNSETLTSGEVQYLSAGNGIQHSEYNMSPSKDLRLLQIWILPPEKNLPTLYGSQKFSRKDRKNRLLNIISPKNGEAKIKLYQDVNIYVCELDAGKEISYEIAENRQVYYVQISSHASVNSIELFHGDAIEIMDEKVLNVKAVEDTHFLFIEMAKG
jgi:redox-sensitive bicupin YhaK (pirin superfamily)